MMVLSGRAMHEILHALGLFHEQSRNDRDRFVKVVWENVSITTIIKSFTFHNDIDFILNLFYTLSYLLLSHCQIIPSYKGNFEKQSLENSTYAFEYDYVS
jgi:hypothetical protein